MNANTQVPSAAIRYRRRGYVSEDAKWIHGVGKNFKLQLSVLPPAESN
jgi:hypothetical protein